jgi:hypothetical protein
MVPVSFDVTSVLLAAVVVLFAVWALRSTVLAVRTDTRRRDSLRAFAAEQGLREKEAEGPRSEAEITAEGMRRRWSRNPAQADPPRGSPVFEGTLDGLPLVVDEVWIRSWWTSSRDAHLRMAVELPGLPPGLKVFPAGAMRRLVRRVKQGTEGARTGRPSRLVVSFSPRAEDRAREEGFLTSDRRRILEEHASGAGDAYLRGGRLFVIRPWKAIREDELGRLRVETGLLARRLVGRNEH